MPKGKRVKSTSKSIICNVHDYFDRQSKKQKSTPPKLCKKTAEATGFSERTVNHCELNPIELCWSQVKGHIKEHNQKFTLSAVKGLT